MFIKWFRELGEVRTQLEAEAAQFVGGAATHLRDLPPKNWEAWVILESTRRTQVICCAFMCMTEVLKSKERELLPSKGGLVGYLLTFFRVL